MTKELDNQKQMTAYAEHEREKERNRIVYDFVVIDGQGIKLKDKVIKSE